jgi:hypothetical protein
MQIFLSAFDDVPDPRASNARHDLGELLVSAFVSALCGSSSCAEMAAFDRAKEGLFRDVLRLRHEIPSHDRLATRCYARWSRPHRKGVIADPNRQITTLPQAFVILCVIGHPALLLWDLVATISVGFMRHLKHPQENRPQPISAEWGALQQR